MRNRYGGFDQGPCCKPLLGPNWQEFVNRRVFQVFEVLDGFVRELVPESFETVEFLHGAAVHALGLGLIAQEKLPRIGLAGVALETDGETEAAILRDGDLDVAGEVVTEEVGGAALGGDGLIHGGGVESGLKGVDAVDGLLGKGEALDGEEFQGVDGLVAVDEFGAENGEVVELFEADDGVAGGGEAVLAGVGGGAGLAFGGTGAGGAGGVGAIGGEALRGDGFGGWLHASAVAREQAVGGGGFRQVIGIKGSICRK